MEMEETIREAMHQVPAAQHWRLLPRYQLSRLARRTGPVLLADAAILVFAPDAASAQAAALDLADFHAGCRSVPVLPVALAPSAVCAIQRPLALVGAAPLTRCPPASLPWLLAHVASLPAAPGFDPCSWAEAPYHPVPGLLQAACALYARHGDATLALAAAGPAALARIQAAIQAAIAEAQSTDTHRIVFVTGDPGAGKTVCGLDTAFAPGASAAFLTANPALLHVLRGALIRDAAAQGLAPRAARQRIGAVIQPLHHVRNHHAAHPGPPPDRILVIDEAQRCWTAIQARRKTHRTHKLQDSEPAILLDAMARHQGWCAILCLLGGGQEIHAGEGGLATWCEALQSRPTWHVSAPPEALDAPDPRQRLHPGPNRTFNPALHLSDPLRASSTPRTISWVNALLEGDAAAARGHATPDPPFRLTRALPALRDALRGPHRSGLVASAGARRLRAEGLGGLLWHQDEDAVQRWFLDPWPDVRSSDALEVAATEFGIQGLELDRIGLCWDLDLIPTTTGWAAQAFRATRWTAVRDPVATSNKRNAYRVLLTRARIETVIWVPRGCARDPTRNPALYDAIAETLLDCGARLLDDGPRQSTVSPPLTSQPVLL